MPPSCSTPISPGVLIQNGCNLIGQCALKFLIFFAAGGRVVLAEGFADVGDAGLGCLQPGDVGEVVEVTGSEVRALRGGGPISAWPPLFAWRFSHAHLDLDRGVAVASASPPW